MLILSNALTNVVDEGCVKVANSLVKRLKKTSKNISVVTFDRVSDLSDEFLTVNKFLFNRKLISILRKNKGEVLYIPFPAKPVSTALRIFILSLFAGKNFRVVLSMTSGINFVSKVLLKLSRARLIVFSRRSCDLYRAVVGMKRVNYLKAGVDTEKFLPVSQNRANELKLKYGFDPKKKLVLHVGHLNRGRNVQQLMKLTDEYEALLVSSTLTKNEQDLELKQELLTAGVRIIDTFIPNIEELYQMADVYFFPVEELGKCIDVPLSCMEAASCNKPIVTTDFGEMREFINIDGVHLVCNFEKNVLNAQIRSAIDAGNVNTRSAVVEYDWKNAVSFLTE